MNNKNIILTGLPRSGSTLICYLLNKAPNTVALDEPMDVGFPNGTSNQVICEHIENFFATTRQSALQDNKVISKQRDGKVPDNSFVNERDSNGLRTNRDMQKSFIQIDNPISEDFRLCIKHNGFFTALLKVLTPNYPCYATIRNPLSVLASWNSVNAPVNQGHIPVAESIDPELYSHLQATPDTLNRQLHILSWFFNHYHQNLSKDAIIRYEDVIDSGGASLSNVVPEAAHLSESLASKNLNQLYDQTLMHSIGERLLNTDGGYWFFYSKESVKELLSKLT